MTTLISDFIRQFDQSENGSTAAVKLGVLGFCSIAALTGGFAIALLNAKQLSDFFETFSAENDATVAAFTISLIGGIIYTYGLFRGYRVLFGFIGSGILPDLSALDNGNGNGKGNAHPFPLKMGAGLIYSIIIAGSLILAKLTYDSLLELSDMKGIKIIAAILSLSGGFAQCLRWMDPWIQFFAQQSYTRLGLSESVANKPYVGLTVALTIASFPLGIYRGIDTAQENNWKSWGDADLEDWMIILMPTLIIISQTAPIARGFGALFSAFTNPSFQIDFTRIFGNGGYGIWPVLALAYVISTTGITFIASHFLLFGLIPEDLEVFGNFDTIEYSACTGTQYALTFVTVIAASGNQLTNSEKKSHTNPAELTTT